MMGDIGEIGGKLSEQCGITPRIFEYLFTRIGQVGSEKDHLAVTLRGKFKCYFLILMPFRKRTIERMRD